MKYPLVFLLLAADALAQQPFLAPRGIVNAASYVPQGLRNSYIARGSMFTLFGRNLGPASAVQASQFPLQPALGGVSIKITQGTTSVDAYPVFVLDRQINAILPSNAPTGLVSIQVTYNNQRSNPLPAGIVTSSFGAFSVNSAGSGPGIFQNFVSPESQPINSLDAAATPGQAVTLWGTGLGPGLGPDNLAPVPGDLPREVEVFVGGVSARSLYAGRSPCCAGIDQIVFEIPNGAPLGCYVPVQVRSGGRVSNTTTLAIAAQPGACANSGNPLADRLRHGGKIALLGFLRTIVRQDVGRAASDATADNAVVSMREERASPFAFNPLFSLPPAGSCATYAAAGDIFGGALLPGSAPTSRFLDAGAAYTLSGPRGARAVNRPRSQIRGLVPLGSALSGTSLASTLFLDPGAFSVSAGGGTDIGRFSANFNVGAPLTWSNRDAVLEVDRTKPLTLNWTGAPSGLPVAIIGGGVTLPFQASSLFVCVSPPGANSFTVPPNILANMPLGSPTITPSKTAIYLGPVPYFAAVPFNADGSDVGAIVSTAFVGKTVLFY